MASSSFLDRMPPKIDEVAFDCCSAALRDAGMRMQHVGMSVICSMDLYDARTISNGLVSPAVGGYLSEEIRIEGDATLAIIAAACAIRARKADAAVVVAVHSPEIFAPSGVEHRAFLDHISNYTFEPHVNRAVGMSRTAVLGMQAAYALDSGRVTTSELGACAADEINRGRDRSWGGRACKVSAEDVLAAAPVAAPLTERMMPAPAVGVVAIVLTSEVYGRRVRGRRGWLRSSASATSGYTWDPSWLTDPMGPSSVAAARAYERAGIADVGQDVTDIECIAMTPALRPYVLDALTDSRG